MKQWSYVSRVSDALYQFSRKSLNRPKPLRTSRPDEDNPVMRPAPWAISQWVRAVSPLMPGWLAGQPYTVCHMVNQPWKSAINMHMAGHVDPLGNIRQVSLGLLFRSLCMSTQKLGNAPWSSNCTYKKNKVVHQSGIPWNPSTIAFTRSVPRLRIHCNPDNSQTL